MPLIHSKSPKAFKTNVGTLMHDIGKSPHVQSRAQALAIAYSTARRAARKYARKQGGGGVEAPEFDPAQLPRGYLDSSTRALGRLLAPNLTDYLSSPHGDTPPPRVLPSGKISSGDPRLPGVASDVGNLMTLPFGLEGGAEMLGARGAARMAPSMAERALAQSRGTRQQILDLASGAGGAGFAASPAAASPQDEGPGERPTALPDELRQIEDINKHITELGKQRQIATSGKGPKGAGIAAQPFDAQIARLNDEIGTINKQVTERQNIWDARKAEFDKQTAPFGTREPAIADRLKAAPALSAGTGYLLGRAVANKYPGKIPALARLGTYIAGAGGGALEGTIGGGYPTYADLDMPEGTQARTTAEQKVADPGFWQRAVAPEAIGSTLTGALGTKWGMMGPLTRMAFPNAFDRTQRVVGRLMGEGARPAAEAAPAAAVRPPKIWPDKLDDSEMFKGKDGKWRQRGTGHLLPARLQPEEKARGGSINPYYAGGGMITPPFGERMAARSLLHEGALNSVVPGRTDKLPITVGGGAYVLPADHMAALGQGNSTAGANIMNRMLKIGPYGSAGSALHGIRPQQPKLNLKPQSFKMPHFAPGGVASRHKGVPIIAAGGEFVIPPEKVAEIGGGDIDHGHKILDHWVMRTREKHIATLRSLKPPKKN